MSQTCVELVGVAYPFQSGFAQVVECHEVVVAWYPVHGLQAKLSETLEEVLAKRDCCHFLVRLWYVVLSNSFIDRTFLILK